VIGIFATGTGYGLATFGVINSGYGRELGVEGIDSYTVSQSISAAAQAN
jgi:acyl-CoA reductase-like NAD-dependent aldehyde dehydrogenase